MLVTLHKGNSAHGEGKDAIAQKKAAHQRAGPRSAFASQPTKKKLGEIGAEESSSTRAAISFRSCFRRGISCAIQRREDEAVRPHSGRRLVPLSRTWQQGYARTWKRVNEQRHACPGRRAGEESADDCERLAPPRGRDRDAAQTENRVIAGDPPAPRRPVLLPRG